MMMVTFHTFHSRVGLQDETWRESVQRNGRFKENIMSSMCKITYNNLTILA
jgi:hypothetical protein